jgi:hypothetical protein
MDVKTQALDRVVEAISPVLASELDRVVQETREMLEREFRARLETELEQALRQAKEEARRQASAGIEEQFIQRLDAATSQLKAEAREERARFDAELTELKQRWAAERAEMQRELEQWRALGETQRLVEATSQAEILSRFLRLAEPFADGLALYVSRADNLSLWKNRGRGAFPQVITEETKDPDSYFRTISVRGKTVGAICAIPTFRADALNLLADSLERAIEMFGLRLHAAGPRAAAP